MAEMMLSTWSFGPVGNVPGMELLRSGGTALDAAVLAATKIEDDPSINSVGVGGLPDADGHVSLDACVMTDPNHCGSVAFIRKYPNPAKLARRVMERTIHVMLVGQGAEEFAEREGFQTRALLTDFARREWEKWRDDPRHLDRERYRGWIPPLNVEERTRSHDTVSIIACDRYGQLGGVCTTSGMAFKAPGRVGDSPIIGHGLYVDQSAGAAAATGNGELIMGTCGSFLAVECMRKGASPLEAVREVLERIVHQHEIDPDHQVALIAVAPGGRAWASGAIKPGFHHTISDERGTRVEAPPLVLMPEAGRVQGPTARRD